MYAMVQIEITENDGAQRLDRFLKKHYGNAPLSLIYKMIRKDVKINGRRGKIDTMLQTGDVITVYLDKEKEKGLRTLRRSIPTRRQFGIAYEDDDILVVEKPLGLLTHGDRREKKNTLANQVMGYLKQQGSYDPAKAQSFVPAPVNRLDRNTTGLVIFGKNAASLRTLNAMMRSRDGVEKHYLTIVAGNLREEMLLQDRMERDEGENRTRILKGIEESDPARGVRMETRVEPWKNGGGYSLVKARLITGRTHQIRSQLAEAGYPIIGDAKYGEVRINDAIRQRFGLTTQLLHAWRLVLCEEPYRGLEITAKIPRRFVAIAEELFKESP